MTPGLIRESVVAQRVAFVRDALTHIRQLPLEGFDDFAADRRNPAAAESLLRRALEALLDLGRHVLVKGFAVPAAEYKAIATGLRERAVLDTRLAERLREMAGYRNRLVHFYDEITERELYEIATEHLTELEEVLDAMLSWLRLHPDRVSR